MNEIEWNATTDSQSAIRRAAGRRRYNRMRQTKATARRMKLLTLLEQIGFQRGAQTKIAKALGVHRSTICRDFEYFFLLERGLSPFEIFLRRKAQRGRDR